MSGNGSRKDLIPDNNKIINNKIHDTDVINNVSQAPAIYLVNSVGSEISNNEIYNGTAYVIRITDANDILIKRNEIYNAVTMSSDAGAVTWGRDITLLGFQVIENYFHDIGNDIGIPEQESSGIICTRTGQQALFHDDGSSGPYAYGNIFYQSKANGERNEYTSIKANGGQYGIWENNIFIGGESAAYFGSWRTGNNQNAQDIWWLRQYNLYDGDTALFWDRISNSNLNFFENEVWQKKYNAQFGAYWTLFTPAQKEYLESVYDSSIKSKDNTHLMNAAAEHADLITNTNTMKNNVLIDTLTPVKYMSTANYHEAAGSVTGEYTTQEAQGFFKNYGTDFTLTEEGLLSIQQIVPAFQAIDFEAIGLQRNVEISSNKVNESTVSCTLVNESNFPKQGLLIFVSKNGDEIGETKILSVTVPAKGTAEKSANFEKPFTNYTIFVIKDFFSMQIFSNLINGQ